MTLDDSVHGMRLRVMQRAQALGNVSAVCRELGISRTLFYRWRKRFERYGIDGVHPRRQRARHGRPVQVPAEVERLVLSVAISTATWGCGRIAPSRDYPAPLGGHPGRASCRTRCDGPHCRQRDRSYLARFHTASAVAPVVVAGLTYFSSSAVSDLITRFWVPP